VLGLFAIPEIAVLAGGKDITKKNNDPTFEIKGLWQGALMVFKRPGLFLRSMLIGVIVGMVPGVGGETAPYLAYAAAKKKNTEVQGRIEGVIAPESSNNAKEGGALVPTLALGIPGSAAMALLLGGFLIMGLEPGPDFLEVHLDLAIGLALLLAATNFIAALFMVPLSIIVAKMASIRGQILSPVLLILIVLGAYASGRNIVDVILVFVFGMLGILMKYLNYSRPALVLGFILGPILETYLYISLKAYGVKFFFRPLTFSLSLLLIAGVVWGFANKSNKIKV
jgi:TctA family transporter